MENLFELGNEIQNELDEKMQEGYRHSMLGNSIAASNIWLVLWGKIKETMSEYNFEFIDDLDNKYQGSQSIYNWATDFDMELENAIRENDGFAQSRIDFCTEYIVNLLIKVNIIFLSLKEPLPKHISIVEETQKERNSSRV